mmetsp:Transcript_20985/g.63100  ORF Transcript_20985/g.63100 Transcript_20985/m.63100 type:complete len:220 (-) Transcript_20985:2690-3349(-)
MRSGCNELSVLSPSITRWTNPWRSVKSVHSKFTIGRSYCVARPGAHQRRSLMMWWSCRATPAKLNPPVEMVRCLTSARSATTSSSPGPSRCGTIMASGTDSCPSSQARARPMAASIAMSSGTARSCAARRTPATVSAGSVAKTQLASCHDFPATASRVMPPRLPSTSPAMVSASRDSNNAKVLGTGCSGASAAPPASARATRRAKSSSSGTTEKPSESM